MIIINLVPDVLMLRIDEQSAPVDGPFLDIQILYPSAVAHDTSFDDERQGMEAILIHLFKRIGVHHFLIDGEGLGTHLPWGDGVGGHGIVDLFRPFVPSQLLEIAAFQLPQQDDGIRPLNGGLLPEQGLADILLDTLLFEHPRL